MLDIQFIRDNQELVATKSRQKGYEIDVHQLLKLDEQVRLTTQRLQELQRQRNELATHFTSKKPEKSDIEHGKTLKDQANELENQLQTLKVSFQGLLEAVPNMPLEDVPIGMNETENKVVKQWGEVIDYDFPAKPHWEIAEQRDLIDKERATKVAGSRFAYIKGDLVRLQFAIIQFVLNTLGDERIVEQLIQHNHLSVVAKPFIPVLPPALVNTIAYEATTRLNAEEVTYKLADDNMWLNASAEHSLCNMYMGEILEETHLPIRYIGYATSFRREAGTYGKDMQGIIRMHQFDKLEMEVFSVAETGYEEHLLLIALQEYMVQQLGLPYQLLNKCTADIGKPNARGVDIETWMPGQKLYRETHTADYMTDYQARRLKTRVRRTDTSNVEFVHTNDATAFGLARIMAAIVENNQTQDGKFIIPEVLQTYMNGKTEI